MEAHGADDVQKMYIVLRPESGERPLEEKQSPDSGKEGKKRSKENKENDNGDADKEKPEGGHGAEVCFIGSCNDEEACLNQMLFFFSNG